MIFNYKVKDQAGKTKKGAVEANSSKEAATILQEQGFLVVDIQNSGGASFPNPMDMVRGVSFDDIVDFTMQLSTMMTAGLTLTDSLHILSSQTRNKTFGEVLEDVLRSIEAGNNLASSLEKHPKYFSRIYIASIRAGESSGMLEQVLTHLAENLEKQREFRSKVKGAMVYPIIILIAMVGVIFIMMTTVVPKLTVVYKDLKIDLPITTQFLIAVSDFFVVFWWLIILLSCLGVIGFILWVRTPAGARLWDVFVLRIPIWGKIAKESVLVEFSGTLGLLIGAGLPILEALNIVSDSLDNIVYRDGLKEVSQKVEKGFPLAVPLSQNEIFPTIIGQMARVGEETGKLDESLIKLSKYFESETEQAVKALTTAIEPIIIIVLGVGVGFLIFSIIMPMYQMTSAF